MNSSGTLVAGVDEVGRGPLAGPVVAAAVILGEGHSISGLRDSKRLSERQRLKLDLAIRENAVAFGIGQCDPVEIDELNILEASMRAMQRAVQDLGIPPGKVLVDGNRCPVLDIPAEAIIGGDDSVAVISAASIVAKVFRDKLMKRLDKKFPEYGFARHKGYPTVAHRAALLEFGPCEIHRKSFAPVRRLVMVTR